MLGILAMGNVRTISYDDKVAGRKVLPFPPDLPFAGHTDELYREKVAGDVRDRLVELSNSGSVYKRANALSNYLATSEEPHREILRIAALTVANELAGLRLMYAMLLAIPPIERMIEELSEFRNVTRLMGRIYKKNVAGTGLRESEEWFKKKVLMLSMSKPLPNAATTPEHAPWLGWSDGVKLALDNPDRRWESAMLERAKLELEAVDLRIKMSVANLDLDKKGNEIVYLFALSEKNKWRMKAVEEAGEQFGGSTLFLKRKLGDRWDRIVSSLRESGAGTVIADLFESQMRKTHPHPQLVAGTAVLRALMVHPLMRRTKVPPDGMSCLSLFTEYAGKGILEVMIPAGKKPGKMLKLPGFDIRDRILRIDFMHAPSAPFVDQDENFREIDWTELPEFGGASYRSLVLTYIDNDNFLAELLENPQAISKPGVVSAIALRSRSSRILSIIANRRDLYTGIVNKDVPFNLLMNPSKIPLMSLRKFIHVRYVDRPTLQRLAGRGANIREEIRREIQRYLSSLG
ncbi:MAG: hypothetical protein JSV33_11845 [bacterium]|nr:MAG: hypothetical protein JSV33_11845 [bacterium]